MFYSIGTSLFPFYLTFTVYNGPFEIIGRAPLSGLVNPNPQT